MPLLRLAQWLNETRGSVAIRESDLVFPLIETVHILALSASVGLVFWVDLRLVGLAMRSKAVSDVVEQLKWWTRGGFALMFLSGSLLLYSEPLKCYNATSFRLKVLLLALAGVNAVVFHTTIYRSVAQWDRVAVAPLRARLAGYASLTLWLGVIIAGRWTAYF